MHEIEFKLEPVELGHGIADVVNILVDGVRLQELARAVELPFALAIGRPELAGDYAGLPADLGIVWPSRHYLDEPAMALAGRPFLLGCVCGIPDCSPLAARIDVHEATVTWSDWRGRWDVSRLGAFEFSRKNYDDALQRLTRS